MVGCGSCPKRSTRVTLPANPQLGFFLRPSPPRRLWAPGSPREEGRGGNAGRPVLLRLDYPRGIPAPPPRGGPCRRRGGIRGCEATPPDAPGPRRCVVAFARPPELVRTPPRRAPQRPAARRWQRRARARAPAKKRGAGLPAFPSPPWSSVIQYFACLAVRPVPDNSVDQPRLRSSAHLLVGADLCASPARPSSPSYKNLFEE